MTSPQADGEARQLALERREAALAAAHLAANDEEAARAAEEAMRKHDGRLEKLAGLRPKVDALCRLLRLEAAEAVYAEASAAPPSPSPAGGDAEGASPAAPAQQAALPERLPAWARPLDLAPLVGEVAAVGGLAGDGGTPVLHAAALPAVPSPRPGSAKKGGGAAAMDAQWWDWETAESQQRKGWSMSEAQQMLRRLEHVYAHAEAMQSRTLRLRARGRGETKEALRALTSVQPAQSFAEVKNMRKDLEASVAQRRVLMADNEPDGAAVSFRQ